MGYNQPFNPILPGNDSFSPNKIGTDYTNPTVSMIPDCDVKDSTQLRIEQEWQAFLNLYGFSIYYKRSNYNFTKADFLFGEDSTSPYPDSKIIKGFVEIENNVHFFSKIGEENTKNVILTISISDYQSLWGLGTYPLAGDQFRVKNMTCRDIEKKSSEVYKVTDKNLGQNDVDVNFGGYVWKINAVRLDYSHENNGFKEQGNTEGTDDDFMGKLKNGMPSSSEEIKPYAQNVNIEAKKDMNKKRRNNIYGNDS